MDPFDLTVIALAAIFGGGYALVKKFPDIVGAIRLKKAENKKKKQEELENSPEYQEELIRKRKFENAIDKTKTMSFLNTKNSEDKIDVRLREEFQFDIDKDIVVKGTLRCNAGSKIEMPIYLYQPRLFASNNGKEICIGPKLTKDGKLNNKYIYVAKKPGNDTNIFYGYVPKAEISTGSEYDFVKNNPFTSDRRILEFINITLDTDSKGNTLPLDLKNPETRKEVEEYIKKYQDTNIFYEYARQASKALADKEEKENLERIREDAIYQDQISRVQKEEKANETKKEETIDKEKEAYKQYYEDQYGYYGVKSPYNKYNELQDDRMRENKPPIAPPPPRGPRR